MTCQVYECQDDNDSIGPDGQCHDYDETLEKRHEDLKVVANECGTTVKSMDSKMKELMAQLQEEMAEKENLQTKL